MGTPSNRGAILGGTAAAAAHFLLPAAAGAAEASETGGDWPRTIAGVFSLLLILALAALIWQWRRARGARAARAELAAVLGVTPHALLIWAAKGAPAGLPGLSGEAGFDAVLDGLAIDDRAPLRDAVAGLRERGQEFDRVLTAADGCRIAFAGRQAPPVAGAASAHLLWMADVSAAEAERAALAGKAEAAAAEAARLRRMLDSVPVPVWHRSSDLVIDDYNRIYGAAVEGETAPDGGAPEIAAAAIAGRGRALAERARETGMAQSENHHVVISGARRWLELTEAPLADGRELVGYALDFTDLEDAQAELARHVAAHAEILEHIGVGVAIFAADQRLIFFNDAFRELWGMDEGWLRQKPGFGELLEALREQRRLPEYADFRAFKEAWLATFTSVLDTREELAHLPDGRTLHVMIRPHPFGGLIMTFNDVTDRLSLERSFNTLTAVQRETLDHLSEGVAVYGSDGRLKLNNPAYRRLWSLTDTDLAGEPHIGVVLDKARTLFSFEGDWLNFRERVVARLDQRRPGAGRLARTDGTTLEYTLVPLPDGATLISYTDVTDSLRVERALRERTEALETADRLKSEFIANISYELRTPLNVIIGFTEVLHNNYFGGLTPKQTEYLDGILSSSRLLLGLINDLLDLATIEAGYMALDLGKMNVAEALTGVFNLMRERARQKNIALEMACAPDMEPVVADERRIRQAVFNLLSNGIKFTPDGGTVKLLARRDGGEIVIAVSDTGIGIPREDQERVMQSFERGAEPRSGRTGAGLGLSLVKSFVELHGGRVDIESEPDKGTTVICRLPVAATVAD